MTTIIIHASQPTINKTAANIHNTNMCVVSYFVHVHVEDGAFMK